MPEPGYPGWGKRFTMKAIDHDKKVDHVLTCTEGSKLPHRPSNTAVRARSSGRRAAGGHSRVIGIAADVGMSCTETWQSQLSKLVMRVRSLHPLHHEAHLKAKCCPGRPNDRARSACSLARPRACSLGADLAHGVGAGHAEFVRPGSDERTREKQRAEKLPGSAAIKLSSVVTDLHGVTGRDIMDHLIAGEHSPKVLAQLARARARRKISELEEALEARSSSPPSTPRCWPPCWRASTGSTPRSAG